MSLNLFNPVANSTLATAASGGTAPEHLQAVAPQCSSRLALLCRLLCLTGLCISGYLAWTTLNTQPAIGCGSDGVVDCGHVLDSKWSKVWGVPVSIPAVTLYLTLLALLCFVRYPAPVALQRSLWTLLTLGFLMAGAAAVWFISLQLIQIGHICPWCMATHSCSLILAAVALFNTIIPAIRKQQAAGTALVAVALLAMVQHSAEEPIPEGEDVSFDSLSSVAEAAGETTDLSSGDVPESADSLQSVPTPPETPQDSVSPAPQASAQPLSLDTPQAALLSVLAPGQLFTSQLDSLISFTPNPDEQPPAGASDNSTDNQSLSVAPKTFSISIRGKTFDFQLNSEPLLGSENAKFIFLEMADYTCPHCRANHTTISKVLAMKQYADNVAAIVVPAPLDRACNSATNSSKPGACELARLALAVHESNPKLFAGYHDWLMHRARTPAEARAEAEKLVGKAALDQTLANRQPDRDISRNVELYRAVGAGVVPKLIFENSLRNGGITQNDLVTRINKALESLNAAQNRPNQAAR
jgi:uncharacterized membrane protein/protein-disulfide isomerase